MLQVIPNFTSNFCSILIKLKVLISIPKFNRQLRVFFVCFVLFFFLIKRRKKAVELQELVKNKTKLIKEQKNTTSDEFCSKYQHNAGVIIQLPC